MAYFSQEMKKAIAPKIKEILKKYDMKGSLRVRDHSAVVFTAKSGPINFDQSESSSKKITVIPVRIESDFSGKARDFLNEIYTVLSLGNHNNSDVQTDYFDVGWYVDIQIGDWGKEYVLIK
jgi:hypothetical protein